MLLAFFAILLFAATLALIIYRFQGKRELFSIDIVQFIYLFVLAPVIFVWFKAFTFFSLRDEIPLNLNVGQYFILDTILSVVGLYLFGILAIHTITKVFWLEKHKDPFADIFEISEYFHLWWSHVLMYLGGFVLITIISFLNLFFPISTVGHSLERLAIVLAGVLFGLLVYVGIWNSDPKQKKRSFLRLMHLSYILFFLIHVFLYLWLNPSFRAQYAVFWFNFFTFLTTVIALLIIPRSSRIGKLRQVFVHQGWGNNVQLFNNHDDDE